MRLAESNPSKRHERDYIERTIATVRNHRDADNCWPQWANIFADEIEACWAELDRLAKSNPSKRSVTVRLVGEWIADPREFVGDGRDDARALAASDAELADEMRRFGSKEHVLREWNLLQYVEVFVGEERVW